MRRAPSASAVVFALLVLATIAAFAVAQRLKRDPLVLDHVTFGVPASRAFTPNRDCRFDSIRVRFRVTRSDRANVQVVKPGGKLVVTLARDVYLKRYRFVTFYWDGRRREDGVAGPRPLQAAGQAARSGSHAGPERGDAPAPRTAQPGARVRRSGGAFGMRPGAFGMTPAGARRSLV